MSVIATHPYEAQREDEISFEKDEVIKVTDFSDSDWWVGKKKDGSLGFFPRNFVTESEDAGVEKPKEDDTTQDEAAVEDNEVTPKVEGETETEAAKEEAEEEMEAAEEKKVDQVIGMARVMEDYAMQEIGEISLHRGGIINVYEVIDSEWSRGELNGKIGKYPSKYVEDIDMPGRPDLGKQQGSSEQKSTSADDDAPKGGFKLAAFGVKQGGIGSLFAGGGFPGLKKTGVAAAAAKPKEEPKPELDVSSEPAAVVETEQEEEEKPLVVSLSTPEQPKPVTDKLKSLGKAIVLHPYDAESEDELSLLRGEYVEILDRNADEGWWKGSNERGQSGIFPSNFVRELEEENVAPPTPTRTRRSVQQQSPSAATAAAPPPVPSGSRPTMARPPQVLRPSSVQTPATARPISVQPPAQRPSSISHITGTATASKLFPTPVPVASLPIAEEPKEEDIKDEEKEQEEETPVESPEKVQSPPPIAAERKPASISQDSIKSPVSEHQTFFMSEEATKSPEVIQEEPISDEEEKESAAEDIVPIPVSVVKELEEEENIVEPAVVEEEKNEEQEDLKEEKDAEEQNEFKDAQGITAVPVIESNVTDSALDTTEEEVPVAAAEEPTKAEESIEEEKKMEEEEAPAAPVEEEEKNEFDIIPTGPKLTTPVRARIGGARARRSPAAVTSEPSQTELLQKELEEEAKKSPVEEEKSAPSPPAKPVKPIFAKFPTPFATGTDVAISKTHLKPTQTRRLWDDKPTESAPSPSSSPSNDEVEPQRPAGVKNIASRFNFAGPSGGGSNDVLETKLKNHTKNEVEKLKKEFDMRMNEENERIVALEKTVQELMERLKFFEGGAAAQ